MKEYSESSHKKGHQGMNAVLEKATETSGERSTLQSIVARNKKHEKDGTTLVRFSTEHGLFRSSNS